MLRIVGEALWSPVKHYQVTILFMVLVLLMDILLKQKSSVYQVYMPHPDLKVSYIIWGCCAYLGVLIASVIVSLHKMVIFGRSDRLIRIIPTSVELTYALYCVAMAVLLNIVLALSSGAWVFLMLNFSSMNTAFAGYEEVVLWAIFAIPFIVSLQFMVRLYLTFPRVALDQERIRWSPAVLKATSLMSVNSVAIIFLMILSILVMIGFELIRIDLISKKQLVGWELSAFDFAMIFFSVCMPVMFATVLSVVYREAVLPLYREHVKEMSDTGMSLNDIEKAGHQ